MGNDEKPTSPGTTTGKTKGSGAGLSGGVAEANKKLTNKHVGSTTEKCPATNQIIAVEILDGGDKAATGTVKQYVNLSRDAKWVDGNQIKNTDRLSEILRVRVRFQKPGTEKFTLKLIPDGANAKYSDTEKGRNAKYRYTDQEQGYVTQKDGTKIVENGISVAAAGGDKYWVEAQDAWGKKVRSTAVETIRRLYLQEVTTKGLARLAADKIQAVQKEFESHKVELIPLQAVQQTVHDGKVRQSADTDAFKAAVAQGYQGSLGKQKKPYVVVLAYLHSMAFRRYIELVWPNRKVGPGVNDIFLPLSPRRSDSNYLWADRAGTMTFGARFTPQGAGSSRAIDFKMGRIHPVIASTGPADKYDRIRLQVNDLTPKVMSGTIEVRAHIIDKFPAGVSFYDDNVVAFCQYSNWKKMAQDDHIRVLVHEIGHKIGMVSDGGDLDKGKFYYDHKTGNPRNITSTSWGPHCSCGLPSFDQLTAGAYDIDAKKEATFDIIDVNKHTLTKVKGKPRCVMFGMVGSRAAFCKDCGNKIRKKDLGNPQTWKNWKSRSI